MEIWSDVFQVEDDLIWSTLIDLREIRFGGSLGCKLQDDQESITRASVGSKSTSLSAGIPMGVQTLRYDFFSSAVFLPYFRILIFSLPFLRLGSKSTSLSPRFCVCRSRQYNTICWELNLISRFFDFFWLIVWVDGINKCGWCLAGGRVCWLKGRNQILSVSLILHHSLHFHIY